MDSIESVAGPLVNGKYLHWDDLLHRKPPGNLTREEWWWGLKFRRDSAAKTVPLEAKSKGGNFKFVEVDPIQEKLHYITLQSGGHVAMPEQITNPETKDQYYVSSLIEEAITSSQLEGAATTRQVASEMIRSGRKPRDNSEQMILNNYITMKTIGELKDQPLTKKLVFKIHRLITEQTLNDPSAAGRFRKESDGKIYIVDDRNEPLHFPPPTAELDSRMDAMCKFANDSSSSPFIHPVLRSIILHFWLAYDHPFVDGNGRTARALFYWSMLHHDYWLFEFVSISKIILKGPSKYSLAFLHTETDDNDLTYFILYHLDVIHRAIEELYAHLRKQTQNFHEVEKALRGAAGLNHRQKALIEHALRHPHYRYTFASHRTSHNIAYQTARTDILDLVKRGYLETAGKEGRRHYYAPATDLGKRLKKLD
ncbi:MAG: Fic family protein [Candidatus Hydrogenedentes bacterium]|nr:Fic family protein [Candidatus Hydrogenedentota bacterium]